MANAAGVPATAPGNGTATEEEKRLAFQKRAHNARRKQQLNLQRENILSQRTSNPGRREALEAALKHIEEQIEALG